MYKLKKVINMMRKTICTSVFVLDGLFILGILTLIGANFIVNTIFGLYSVALFLIGLSVYLAHTEKK